MYTILNKRRLNDELLLMEVQAPLIAATAQPGQFLLVMNTATSERVTAVIGSINREQGSVGFVVNANCPHSQSIAARSNGDSLFAVLGPLGNSSAVMRDVESMQGKRVLLAADGKGIAALLPIAQRLKSAEVATIIILGAKHQDQIFYKEELLALTDKLLLSTDGAQGYVADMAKTMSEQADVTHIVALGSLPMMQAVSRQAKEMGLSIEVQILGNTFDGSGMSGDGRVTVGDKVMSASVDGPFFDGAAVDFDELIRQRNAPDAARYTNEFPESEANHQYTDIIEPEKNQRVQPQRQTPETRVHNFDEVNNGYTEEQAKQEASRCLNCKKPRCSMMGCPIQNRIPEFIHQIVEGNYEEAYQIISTRSTLPAVCGRVCPHEQQCEGSCVRGMKGEPLAIGQLERFVADWHREHHPEVAATTIADDAKKVAIIGGGPSGMACAHDLAQLGYRVTIFEAMHEAGGVMIYGIPEFVLPKKVVRHEVAKLEKMGVSIVTNAIGGKTVTVDDLMDNQGYDAVYISAGAGLPRFMGIKGETLGGIMSANEILAKVTLMHANEQGYATNIHIGKKVAVIGGGNVAIDAARVARRLGADVTIIYRRDEENMPARRDEIQLAKEENITLCTQTNPVEFLGDDKGNVCGIRCVRMAMGEPDDSGRRSFSVIEGSEFELPIDNVFLALGSSAIPIVNNGATNVATDRKGLIIADGDGRTSRPGVFAGGDIVSGPQTVVLAMGAGRKAAKAINAYLNGEELPETTSEQN